MKRRPLTFPMEYKTGPFGDRLMVPEYLERCKLIQLYVCDNGGWLPIGRPKLPHQFYRLDLDKVKEEFSVDTLYFYGMDDVLVVQGMETENVEGP